MVVVTSPVEQLKEAVKRYRTERVDAYGDVVFYKLHVPTHVGRPVIRRPLYLEITPDFPLLLLSV